ncbi:hypothetical protein [Microseira sp. BLCC-F43]|uniref:hypothetical protein n=1 Tax=Microseira sp. BLCC-F43 TaxID=3153602 RepID=UPI0035B82942
MTNRRVILFFILLLSTVFVIFVIHLFKPDKNNWIDIIIAVSFPILIGIAIYAFLPLLDRVLAAQKNKGCIIYLYGAAGTGKTTLIHSWFTLENTVHQSTNNLACYTEKITVIPGLKITVSVID